MQEVMNWYVAYTKPGCEKKVAQRLTQRGIETYFPRYRAKEQYQQHVEVSFKVLFSRWVFLYCTPAQLSALKGIDGVINVLYRQNKPAIINPEELRTIRYTLDQYQEIELQKISTMEEYSTSSLPQSRAVFSLPSIGFVLLAQGKIESTVSTLPKLPTVGVAEASRISWTQGGIQALLKKLPSVFTSRVVKLPVWLPRKLEQQ